MSQKPTNSETEDQGMSDIKAALLGSAVSIGCVIAVFTAVFLLGSEVAVRPTAAVAPAIAVVPTATAAAAPSPPMGLASLTSNEPASQPTTVATADPEVLRRGQVQYARACVTCHAVAGTGVPNMGNDLTTSEFVRTASVDELSAMIKAGRSMTDPANKSKLPMPPRGGNPALNDAQLRSISVYLQSIVKPKQ